MKQTLPHTAPAPSDPPASLLMRLTSLSLKLTSAGSSRLCHWRAALANAIRGHKLSSRPFLSSTSHPQAPLPPACLETGWGRAGRAGRSLSPGVLLWWSLTWLTYSPGSIPLSPWSILLFLFITQSSVSGNIPTGDYIKPLEMGNGDLVSPQELKMTHKDCQGAEETGLHCHSSRGDWRSWTELNLRSEEDDQTAMLSADLFWKWHSELI